MVCTLSPQKFYALLINGAPTLSILIPVVLLLLPAAVLFVPGLPPNPPRACLDGEEVANVGREAFLPPIAES